MSENFKKVTSIKEIKKAAGAETDSVSENLALSETIAEESRNITPQKPRKPKRTALEIPTVRSIEDGMRRRKSVFTKVDAETPPDRREQGDSIFALDIGTRTIVGVFGDTDDSGDRFIMRDYVVVPHTKRAMIDGQIEDIRQVAKIVADVKSQIEERSNVQLTHVSIAAAGRALKTRHTSMDFDISEDDGITFDMIKSMEIETIQKAQDELDTEFKARGTSFYCVGHSVVTYRLDDYKILSLEGHKGGTATVELIATFLPNVVVEGLYSVMDINGLEVSSLTLEPIAAMNAIIPAEIRLINIALVDIGAGTSDIAISRDGSIIAYAMATTAGDEITEEIIRRYFVDFSTAERIKITCCSGEACSYKDIFSIEQNVTPEDFETAVRPAVEVLAETICENIKTANNGSPAAVFLIGGGSLVCGLSKFVAEKLGIEVNKVALGSDSNLRTIDTGGIKMGAEFVTPLGIAMTCILNKGYDFSVITLNDRKIRIFDTKQLSVFELLNMTGYKSEEIMGRSGRSLSYILNGKPVTVKGGNLEPAQVYVNGKSSSLSTYISQGDSVRFVPAVCGGNGAVCIGDIVDFDKYNSGFVTFGGEKHEIGVDVRVNGRPAVKDYSVQPLDKVDVYGILTVDDLMGYLDVQFEDMLYKVNGRIAEGTHILKNGDDIVCDDSYEIYSDYAVKTAPPETIPALSAETAGQNTASETANAAEELLPVTPSPAVIPAQENTQTGENKPLSKNSAFGSYMESSWGSMKITLNGREVELPENAGHSPHMFLELLNYSELDLDDPKGAYVLKLNGIDASFQDALTDGDTAVIMWDDSGRVGYNLEYKADKPTDGGVSEKAAVSGEITPDIVKHEDKPEEYFDSEYSTMSGDIFDDESLFEDDTV